jgi:amino acid adenylation domain-containing protein
LVDFLAPIAGHDFTPFERVDLAGTLHERFERQARIFPHRLAIRSPRDQFSYDGLNRAANRMAHALLNARGPGQEPVAIFVAQSGLLLAAILAVLKAGKIYVPFEARDPRPRLERMVADVGAPVFLCDAAHHDAARALASQGACVIHVEAIADSSADENPSVSVGPDAFASVYYTSGSTGPAKGVVDTHRNVLHNVMRYTNGLRIGPADRLSLVQSCSFSGCVSTQFSALLNGAALFPFDLRGEGPAALAAWMVTERLTMFHGVPVIFRALGDALSELPDIRLVRLEGDRASWSDVALFRRLCRPGSVLVNGLGTSETGIVRRFFVTHDTPMGTGALPLGDPVEDMDVHIVDEDGHDVGLDRLGAIAVTSAYLATGYWQQPEATARAFRPAADGRRTYVSGDVGRLRADGCLEYHGRRDHVPKIRGEHVDVQAVERALLAMGFAHALVIAREDRELEPRLVAYVVPGLGPPPDVSTIRDALEAELQASSIPAAFVTLDRFPTGEYGKVDPALLPRPGRGRPALTTPYTAPRTDTERAVAAIWRGLLDLDDVGVHDRFLDRGGDSFTAARALVRIRSFFGADIPLRLVFDHPTIAEIASRIDDVKAT